MTDTQLYLAIGIPSFLVVLSLVTNMVQSNRLADRMDRIAEQLSGKIEQQNVRIEQLSVKIDGVAEQQSAKIQGYMVPLHERMAVIEMKQK